MDGEVFNPSGRAGEPLATVADALEAAVCVELARWLHENRSATIAIELDGLDELRTIASVDARDAGVHISLIGVDDDPELWRRARRAWNDLDSLGRTTRRVIAASEAANWQRGWP